MAGEVGGGYLTVSKSIAAVERDHPWRWVTIEAYVLLVSLLIPAYVLYANYQDHGLALWDWDWLFISGFSTFVGAVQIARALPRKLDTLLTRLADRGVFVASGEPGTILRRDARPLSALRTRIGKLEYWATQIVGGLVGLILLLACIVAFGQFGFPVLLDKTGLTVVATAAGYVAGRHIGQMITYGYLGWAMQKTNIAIKVKPGHVDGAAGLKPVGSFYFFQAMLLAIPAVFLGTWWFLFPVWPAHAYDHWRDPYLAMVLVVVLFEVAAFVVPMWRFHTMMSNQKDVDIASADALSATIDELRAQQGKVQAEQTRGQLNERLAAVQQEYWDIENMPTWPVDVETWRRFARNNLVLLLPLFTKLIGADTLAGRILATLDDLFKKQTG